MSCCKSSRTNNENSDTKHDRLGGLKQHMLMIVCCLAPLGAVLLLNQSDYIGTASYLVFMLCPLMHWFMMKWMGNKKQEPANPNNSAK